MNQGKPGTPDDKDNLFLSLGDLFETVSVATLKSAIEREGIYLKNKFGQWGYANTESKNNALNLIRIHYEWQSNFPQDNSAADPRSPMEIWGPGLNNDYRNFGWGTKVLPDFESIRRERDEVLQSEILQRRGVTIKRKAPDGFVGALITLLVDIAKRDPSLDITAMPGLKADLHELAKERDAEFDCMLSTFDTYIGPFCQFKRGARKSSYYRDHFKEHFK